MNRVVQTLCGRSGIFNALLLWKNILPTCVVCTLCFFLTKDNKHKLKEDIIRNMQCEYHDFTKGDKKSKLIILLALSKPFRTVFYLRTAPYSYFIKWLLPGVKPFNMATSSNLIGGGLFIQHGVATGINAKKIGKNLWINQRVSIGWTANGNPTIGNNVTIGVGAVVLGPITIGNNVKIGANAIVVDDVPDNATVCSPKAKIIKITSL